MSQMKMYFDVCLADDYVEMTRGMSYEMEGSLVVLAYALPLLSGEYAMETVFLYPANVCSSNTPMYWMGE